MDITIPKNVLFELMASHSVLSQAEYNRNPAYNDAHPADMAEQKIIKVLEDMDELNNFFKFAR
jgi:hypothetical protein